MGLQIRELVPKKEITINDLKGKIIAVDAFNVIYQFLSNIRQPDGTPLQDSKGRITSHLSGLFYRTINLTNKGLKLVFVFDGIPDKMKDKTHEIRTARREEARIKYEDAKSRGDEGDMFKYSRQNIRLSNEMVEESKELLEAMGLPVVQAPGEGEAQCSYMAKHGDVYAVASQDYDSLLFGAPRLIQNLTLARKRRLASGAIVSVMPELIELEEVLNTLQINHEQLITLGILVGTDFNPAGVRGIGPKKAQQLVNIHKQPVLIFNALGKMVEEGKIPEPDFDWPDVFEIFKKPNITKDYEIKFREMDEKKVKELLCEEHDFSEERVDSSLNKLREQKKELNQKALKDFLG